MLLETVERVGEMTRPAQKPEGGPPAEFSLQEFVRGRILRIMRAVADDADTFRIILREPGGFDREIDDILSSISSDMLQEIETHLKLGQQLKLLRPHDPFFGALLGGGSMLLFIIIRLLAEEEPHDLDHVVDQLADLILTGIGPSRAASSK